MVSGLITGQIYAGLPDTLIRRISDLPPGAKIEALLTFGIRQQRTHPTWAEEAGWQAWQWARAMASPSRMAEAARFLGDFYRNISGDRMKAAYFYREWLQVSLNESPNRRAEVMMQLATDYLLEKKADTALYYAHQAAGLLRRAGEEAGYANARGLAGHIFLEKNQPDSALACFALSADALERLLKVTSPESPQYREYLSRIAEISGTLANTWALKGNYRIASREINKALAHAVLAGNRPLKTRLSLDNADIFVRQGLYEKALEILLNLLGENEASVSRDMLGTIWQKIGEIYAELSEWEKARQYLRKATYLLQEGGNVAATAPLMAAMGDTYLKAQQYDSADACYRRSMEINRKFENLRGLAGDLIRRGNLALTRRQKNEAETYFTEALKLGTRLEPALLTQAQQGLARLSFERKDYTGALAWAEQAFQQAQHGSDLKSSWEMARLMAQSYAARGDFKDAFLWLENSIALADSLNLMGHRREMARLQARYDFEKKEAELALEKEKSRSLSRNQRLILYFSIVGILLAIVIAWLAYRREKERRLAEQLSFRQKEELALTRQALMEAEVKARELEQKQLMEDLRAQASHLTNLALIIAQKNEFINQLKEQIKKLRSAEGGEKDQCAAALLVKLNQQQRLNADLERFRKEVETVHEAFYRRLTEICPSLTDHDKELAGLLRIGLTSKDIASLNNVSVKAVEMSRYRLRKKLNLTNDTSLVEFIRQLT